MEQRERREFVPMRTEAMQRKGHNYPTAKHIGDDVVLALYIGDEMITGKNAREFLHNMIAFIEKSALLDRLGLPFTTSGSNTLVARSPRHSDGRDFVSSLEYRPAKGGPLFINVSHPRFFALRQGVRLAEAVGFTPTLVVHKTDHADKNSKPEVKS